MQKPGTTTHLFADLPNPPTVSKCPFIGHSSRSRLCQPRSPSNRHYPVLFCNPHHSGHAFSHRGAVYKGCTPDAHRVYKGFSLVHPVSIRCTPLVHGYRARKVRRLRVAFPDAGAGSRGARAGLWAAIAGSQVGGAGNAEARYVTGMATSQPVGCGGSSTGVCGGLTRCRGGARVGPL